MVNAVTQICLIPHLISFQHADFVKITKTFNKKLYDIVINKTKMQVDYTVRCGHFKQILVLFYSILLSVTLIFY